MPCTTWPPNVDYPTLNGGVRDYTEFQSQLLERWITHRRGRSTTTWCTTRPESRCPTELVAKLEAAEDLQPGVRRPPSTWPRRFMDMKLPHHGPRPDVDRRRLRARGAGRAGDARRACRCVIAAPTSVTSSPVRAIRPATTATCGRTSSPPTPPRRSRRRRAASTTKSWPQKPGGPTSSPPATPSTRPRPTAPSAVAMPTMEALMRDRGFPVPGEGAGGDGDETLE